MTARTRLGAYEIHGSLGAGGMGEVYRARDTRLQRDVAIKVLPVAFASDAERLARFSREAQLLASLNHPHIAHVYGIEDVPDSATTEGKTAGGFSRAIVMELVDGHTLADRIAEGPVPLDEAVPIARQIADALDAAHERGIVHRDLKPANIKLTPDGTVKVLDFGLAKALDTDVAGSPASAVPNATAGDHPVTMTSPAMTQHGVILGTAAYMSPEQARGKPVDKRADIWAFGVVLFEMLTGKTLFTGDTVSDTIAEVLKRDIDLRALPPATPPSITQLIARCLHRDPKKRLRDVADALHDLDWPAPAAPETLAASPRRSLAASAAVIGLVAAAAALSGFLTWASTRSAPPPAAVVRASYDLPGGLRLAIPRAQIAISPDGRYLAAIAGGIGNIAIKRIDQLEWTILPGTDIAAGVFFSPDNQFVGYWTSTAIRKVPVTGGTPSTIHVLDMPLSNGPEGVAWADDGNMYYGDGRTGIYAVNVNGGPRREVLKDGSFPYVPRGSRVLLYQRVTRMTSATTVNIFLHPFDGGEDVDLGEGRSPVYLSDGTLLFIRDNALLAAPLDLNGRRLSAEPVVVEQQIATIGAVAQYAVSVAGTLAYVPGQYALSPLGKLRRVTRLGVAAAPSGCRAAILGSATLP